LRFDVATEADDPEIRRLLRENPMAGAIRVSLETEPSSFHAAAIQGDVHQLLVARDESGRLAGMAGRSVLDAWVNGEPRRLGYLSQLRVDGRHRRRPRLLLEGNERFLELHADGETPLYVTTILADNAEARRLLERGLPGLPTYRPREEIVTLVMPSARRVRSRERGGAEVEVERAGEEDLDAIVACLERHGRRFNFAPRWSREDLLSNERTRGLRPDDFLLVRLSSHVAGCVALWRQDFKQAIVRGYDRRLGVLRPLLNLARPLVGAPRLPRAGVALRSVFLSHFAVDDDDPRVALALVSAAHARAVELPVDYVHLGLARRHPLLAPIQEALPHREYPSILYLVHWEDGARAADGVDERIPHLEVAIL